MIRKTWTILLFLLLFLLPARAQFYTAGDDPCQLRWYYIETPYYRIIYPEGTDSLARVYGQRLEQFRVPVGRSIGVTPGDGFRRRMPVVLHTHYSFSNGSVGWAPRRMDLYTRPEAYGSDPTPWEIQLTAHEPRHQAQMQMAHKKRWTRYLVGEGWAPIAWYALLSQAIGEGDAVAVETGIASGTRARTADFLEYFDLAFDRHDWRSWNRWRLGSYKHYTPDLYKLGYMTVAGARYRYDAPLITQEAWETARRKPWILDGAGMRRAIKRHAGERRFSTAFRGIQEDFRDVWEADALARGPFMPMEQLTRSESFPLNYHLHFVRDNTIFATRDGYLHPTEFIGIQNGQVKFLRAFSEHSSSLFYSESDQKVYWAENVADGRWSMNGYSEIRWMDLLSLEIHNLTSKTRYYYPQPSPDGTLLAVVEYPVSGGSNVLVLRAADGSVLETYPAPAGIQAVETAWLDKQIYVSGLSEDGYGIYRLGADWEQLLAPSHQKLCNLAGGDDCLEWNSDRSGKSELYRYYPESGRLLQITSTRFGSSDNMELDGKMVHVSLTKDGLQVFETPLEALQPREVQFADVHRYPIEDKLTEQERALGPGPDLHAEVPVSAPKPYRKWGHWPRFHTWLPLYADYDAVKEASMDYAYDEMSLGVSAYFQNELGTLSGMVGYGLHPSAADDGSWRNAVHLRAVWSGWYPVVEASLDLGDSNAKQYQLEEYRLGSYISQFSLGKINRTAPLATATLKTYVPLAWYRSGWRYGVTPQLSYAVSNHYLDQHAVQFSVPGFLQGTPTRYLLSNAGAADNHLLQRASASVRGYYMRDRAQSQTYPRWGIGAEAGLSLRPGLTQLFRPNLYGYLYGYLPGLFRTQGLKLSAMLQAQTGPADGMHYTEMSASILPAGFEAAATSALESGRVQWKLGADYSIPVYLGDIDLTPILYVKKFEIGPHADYTGFAHGSLWSYGASITASIAHFILPFDGSWGIDISKMGGSSFSASGEENTWSVSLVYSASL